MNFWTLFWTGMTLWIGWNWCLARYIHRLRIASLMKYTDRLSGFNSSLSRLADNIEAGYFFHTTHVHSFKAINNLKLIVFFIIASLQLYSLRKTIKLWCLSLLHNNFAQVSARENAIFVNWDKLDNYLNKRYRTSSRLDRSTEGWIFSASNWINSLN